MMTKKEIISAYEAMGVKRGDVLCVQSGYKGMGGIEGGPLGFAQALMELLGESGTLIMPAYNLESWTEKHYYDSKETPSQVGSICEAFRKSPVVGRTRHPIHSLSVWGHLKKELCALDDHDSFGEESVFRYLLDINALYSSAGLGLEMPFLPCHLTETMMKTPYRRYKNFGGIYVDDNGVSSVKSYGYYVRKDEFRKMETPVFPAHIMQFEMSAFSGYETKGGIQFWIGDARKYHDSLVTLITENPKMFGGE